MDELYGCKKPGENLSKEKYRACLAKERADGKSFFNLEMISEAIVDWYKNFQNNENITMNQIDSFFKTFK